MEEFSYLFSHPKRNWAKLQYTYFLAFSPSFYLVFKVSATINDIRKLCNSLSKKINFKLITFSKGGKSKKYYWNTIHSRKKITLAVYVYQTEGSETKIDGYWFTLRWLRNFFSTTYTFSLNQAGLSPRNFILSIYSWNDFLETQDWVEVVIWLRGLVWCSSSL